jgi:hypothetical protein
MNSDSLTFNPNPLPLENISVFKKYIYSQDECADLNSNIYYLGNYKNGFPAFKQKSLINDSIHCASMFFKKVEPHADFQVKARIQYDTMWMFFPLLICFVFATIFTFINYKRISHLFKAFLLPHFTNQFIREGNIMREFFIYPALLTYFISISFLISTALHYFLHFNFGFSQSLLISLFVLFFFIFRILIIKFIGWVFRTSREAFEYMINNMIFSIVSGVFLFPLVFFMNFSSHFISEILLYLIMIIIGIIFIYRTIRGLMIGLSSERYSLYYLFLYLCTVEILPLYISVKLLITFYLTGDFLK